MSKILFTSESVTEGHPDKICDRISDSILDALLEQDPMSRVACETAITTGLVRVGGVVPASGRVVSAWRVGVWMGVRGVEVAGLSKDCP